MNVSYINCNITGCRCCSFEKIDDDHPHNCYCEHSKMHHTAVVWNTSRDSYTPLADMIAGVKSSNSYSRSNSGKVLHAPKRNIRGPTVGAIDPEASENRRDPRTNRVQYNAVVPHELWHHDGSHKLIGYDIVVHGCVDGATRAVIYVEAADNNRAATVFEIFQRTRDGILPRQILGDNGDENIMIRRFMNAVRPPPQVGYIQGTSAQNLPIVRLWRQIKMQSTQFYSDFFNELTLDHACSDDDSVVCLDAQDSDHLFVLHYLFIPMINDALIQWARGWNFHKIRTEHSHSPLRMLHDRPWYAHALDTPEDIVAAAVVAAVAADCDDDDDGDGDGLDDHANVSEDGVDDDGVANDFPEHADNAPQAGQAGVLSRHCGLDERQLEHFKNGIQPCRLSTHPERNRNRLKEAFFSALAFYYECKNHDFE
jgi:hypothetical protein